MSGKRSMSGHHGTVPKSDEWITPKSIIDALGGPFDLDPCAAVKQPWATAETMWTENGLEREWFGQVWLNPPYTRGEVGRWLGRLAEHAASDPKGRGGVALIFARTETREFHECVWGKASAVLFLEGRLHFHYVDGRRAQANAGAPSCLVAYGEDAEVRLEDAARDRRLPGAFLWEWSHYRVKARVDQEETLFDG